MRELLKQHQDQSDVVALQKFILTANISATLNARRQWILFGRISGNFRLVHHQSIDDSGLHGCDCYSFWAARLQQQV
jgi:hypothetical protein